MKQLNLKLILAAAALALALVAAGCGGDDDEGESSGPALSKEEYIAQGDEICAQGDTELAAAAEEEFGSATEEPPREDQEAFISDVVAPNFEQQLEDLQALNPPEEDQEQIDALLAALEDLIAAAKEDPGTVIDGEVTEASELAQEYGFQSCGS